MAFALPAVMRTPALVKAAPSFIVCVLLAVASYFQVRAMMQPRPRALGGAVAITDVTFEDDGKSYVVHAHVTNKKTHGVYVYTMERGHDFDEATGTLTVQMHTVPHRPPPNIKMLSCHTWLPSMRRIPPSGSTDLIMKMSRTQPKMGDGGWTQVPYVPTRVRVELGWSNTEITGSQIPQSLCGYDADERIQDLERGVVTQTSQ
jgi:hypothetical protein